MAKNKISQVDLFMNDSSVKKIFLVISSLHVGGAQRVMVILANYWARKGISVELLVLSSEHSSQYAVEPSIKICFLPMQIKSSNLAVAIFNNVKRILKIRGLLKKTQASNIVSFIDRTNVLILLASIGLKKFIVVSERSDPRVHPIGAGWFFLRKITYRFANVLVVQTESVKQWAIDYIRLERIEVIPNPISKLPATSEVFAPSKNIYTLARLVPGKGHNELIECFAESGLVQQGWKLTLIGDGPLESKLREAVARLSLDESIVFEGRLSEPVSRMQVGDIFILNSEYEGFPNALLEAMGMGMAVISSDCLSGPSEMIEHGVNGFLFPVGDRRSLINCLRELALNDELRKRLGREAVLVRKRFDEEKILRLWNQILK